MSLQLDLSGVINSAIEAKLGEFNIEEEVQKILGDIAKHSSKIIEIKLEGKEEGKKFPLVHKQFETLLNVAKIQGVNTLLTGGAGLSKSTAVEQVAEAFNLELSSISFSNQTTKTDLLGFVDANGVYRMSGFVDAFKNGKVFLADEMDACSSNVLVLLNSAIANGRLELPNNEEVKAHENFRFIATANTNLRGAKNGYTARNKLDSATIDRFVVIEWELDEELEEKITDNVGWLNIVRKCRKVAAEELDGITITPRSSYDGAKLIKAGLPIDFVIEATIVKAMGEDERKVILKKITENDKAQAVKVDGGVKYEAPKPEPKPKIEEDLEPEYEIDDEDLFKW